MGSCTSLQLGVGGLLLPNFPISRVNPGDLVDLFLLMRQ